MRELKIDTQIVKIPQSWDDLTKEQYIFLSGLMYKYSMQQIDFDTLKIMFLCKILNLKIVDPKKRLSVKAFINYAWAIIGFKFSRIRYKISRQDYIKFKSVAAEVFLSYDKPEDLLAFNLIQIAKEITFLNSDVIDIKLSKNPIPKISGLGKGKKFSVGLIIDTDFTAGTYSDAMDLVIAWEETGDINILNYLVALLYTNQNIHSIINCKNILTKVERLPLMLKYAVYQWFISISAYFFKHPVYMHLFVGKKSEGEKIRLGMSETIIRLSKSGYGSIKELKGKNLIEYMDLQIAELQESIRGALAAGMEPVKLAEKTGRTLTQIEQLS